MQYHTITWLSGNHLTILLKVPKSMDSTSRHSISVYLYLKGKENYPKSDAQIALQSSVIYSNQCNVVTTLE